MTTTKNWGDELAIKLMISPDAISEAVRRGLVSFKKHRRVACWRFGDTHNGCLRRLDGLPFEIKGQRVKAEAETRGDAWHSLIGLDDVFTKDRRDILLVTEGSKDALAALHFADTEGRLSDVGVAAALGAGVNLRTEDIEKIRGRRVRIFGDADTTGQETVSRVGKQLVAAADEVQIFSLAGLHCQNGSLVKDLFDLSRIDCDDFEANRDLWSVTDLNSKGERVSVLKNELEFSFSPLSLPHVSPESHGFLVYPVSNSQDLEKELETLAKRNACTARNTARERRWKLVCELAAVQKRIGSELTPDELIKITFEQWYRASQPHLDPDKTRDDYLAKFLGELGKVRVPTGEGEALKKALEHVSTLSVSALPPLPGLVEAVESWRRLAALHRQLAHQSANGTYFLSCRDAAKAHHGLNKDSANTINHALIQLGVIDPVRIGDARPGGKASAFRYLLPLNADVGAADLQPPNEKAAGRLPQYCRNCRKRVAFSFAIANLAVVQFHEGMADESREPFCVSKFWGLRREIDHDSILGMSFWKYWRDRFWESLMTWYGRAQAIGFVLFLVGGLILSAKAVWFLVSGAFVIGLVVQVCFVSPYQHAKKLQSGLDDQSGRGLDKASELLKRPSQLQPFQGLYAAGVADLETNAQVVWGADKLSEHHEHPMQWMEK